MTDDDARRQFANDQTTAAAAEATEISRRIVRQTSASGPRLGALGRHDRVMQERLNAYVRAGRFTACRHAATSPQLLWYPVPGCPVACPECVGRWILVHIPDGSDEDTRCDACRKGPNRPGTFEQRHLILTLDTPPAPGQGCQAITISYLVCRECMDAE